MAKEYVPIFFDWLEVTQDLTADEKGNLIDAVVAYASGEEYEHLLTGGVRIAFRFLKGQVDRNNAISEARSESRKNKPEQIATNDNKQEQTPSNSPKEKEKEKDKEKENNKESDKKPQKRFTPPTADEVAEYCASIGFQIDPQYFIDYYSARGWELKPGQKVKDWRACVRTWKKRDSTSPPSSPPKKAVVAQNYEQRDYTDVQNEFERAQTERILQRLKGAG